MLLSPHRDTNVAMAEALVRQYDNTIRILWNNRIHRYVVVQHLPKWMPVTQKLRGIVGIEGIRCQFKTMFVCETEETDPITGEHFPVVPGAWVVKRLQEACPLAHDKEDQKREVMAEVEADSRKAKMLDDVADTYGRELDKCASWTRSTPEGIPKTQFAMPFVSKE